MIGRDTAIRLERNNITAKPFHSIKTKPGVKYFVDTVDIIDPFNPLTATKSVSSMVTSDHYFVNIITLTVPLFSLK